MIRIFLALMFGTVWFSSVFSQKSSGGIGDEDNLNVYIPNAFTPNGDGVNDVFKVVVDRELDYFELVVLDRNGEEVYYSDSVDKSWRGDISQGGYSTSPTIFIYFVKLKAADEIETKTYRGHIVMIR